MPIGQKTCFALVLLLCAGLVQSASAIKPLVPPGAAAPAQKIAEEKPAEAKGDNCISDDAGFRQKDGLNTFVVKVMNACETTQKCTVNVYIVGAQGPEQGKATLTLAPKSKGEAAQKSYTMVVKAAGGMANVSRSCRES